VLVVEDQEDVRDFALQALRRCGYDTVGVETCDGARDLLAAGTSFDLVLSDVMMPAGMDGFALAAWIRTERPDTRVALMTGYASAAALNASGLPVLRKPFGRSELAALMEQVLAGPDAG